MIDLRLYPAKSEHARWIELENQAVILNPNTGRYHKLNETASRVWLVADGTRNINEIATMLESEYNVKKDKAKKDSALVIAYLKKAGLINLSRDANRFYPKNK